MHYSDNQIFSLGMIFFPSVLRGFIVLALCGTCHAVQLMVTGDDVCLRTEAKANAEVVTQVSYGTILTASELTTNQWVRVNTPTNVSLWIHGDLVKDGIVTANRARIRSGPSISHSTVGLVEQGSPIRIRESLNEWLEIAPPSDTFLYISRDYVTDNIQTNRQSNHEDASVNSRFDVVDQPPKPITKPSFDPVPPPPLPADVPVIKAAPRTSLPPEIIALAPASSQPQGMKAEYNGILSTADPVRSQETFFRITTTNAPDSTTLCLVLGNKEQLNSVLGRRMTISGSEYWVQNQSVPVLMPVRIVLRDSDKP